MAGQAVNVGTYGLLVMSQAKSSTTWQVTCCIVTERLMKQYSETTPNTLTKAVLLRHTPEAVLYTIYFNHFISSIFYYMGESLR